MADEGAEGDPEQQRREPPEPAASPPPPSSSPPHRRPHAERLAEARRVPVVGEDGQLVAERQGERQRRELFRRCCPPPPPPSPHPEPSPTAAAAAEEEDGEGARAREEAAEGGRDEAAQRRRRERDGLGLGLRSAAAAAGRRRAGEANGRGGGEGRCGGGVGVGGSIMSLRANWVERIEREGEEEGVRVLLSPDQFGFGGHELRNRRVHCCYCRALPMGEGSFSAQKFMARFLNC